jgi:uncharacterized protein (TIRG00374 family)
MSEPPESQSRAIAANKALRYTVIVIVIFGLLVSFANLRRLKEHFLGMDPVYLVLALACSCGVYLLEGMFLKMTLMLFGEPLALRKAFKYSFVINALGYIISLGGLTPFATQAYALGYSGISARKATHTRIIQVIFFNIFFNLLLIAGFIFLFTGNEIPLINKGPTVAAFCAFLLLISFFYLMLLLPGLQKAVLTGACAFMENIARFFSKNARLDACKALSYLTDFHEGFRKLLKNPRLLLGLAGITVSDWFLWVGVLYFSFRTLKFAIDPGILIMGFAVGQIVGIASMVPGGMGTLEGSMALVYHLFGIPFSLALGAALLYRVVLYLVPFAASLPLHLSLRREK